MNLHFSQGYSIPLLRLLNAHFFSRFLFLDHHLIVLILLFLSACLLFLKVDYSYIFFYTSTDIL